MSGKLPYYKRFPKDYLSDENVAVMSLEEEGAYNRLMDYCWLQGSIPEDVERLAKMCRVEPEKMEELWPAIRPCFEDAGEDGRLQHPRLAKERAKALNRKKKLSEAGRKGARARHGTPNNPTPRKSNDNGASQATLKPGQSQAKATLKHSQIQKADTDTEGRRGLRRLLDYLPEGEAVENCVRAVARSAKGSPDTWALGFVGMYGPSGTRAGELGQIPEDDRPTVLLDALQAYLTEGQDWDQRFFSGFLRNAVKRHLGGEGPDFGDESARDAERAASYRQRETERKREEWDESEAEAEAEMAALWEWWDDLDPERRQKIEAEGKKRAGAVPPNARKPIMIGVMVEHKQAEEARAS